MNKMFKDAKSFIDWVEHQKRFSPKISLDKMRFYLSLFDNPHLKFQSIHITGTNGKGSTVAYLKSVLRCAGFNVATFTSPYITCFNERICYNENYISNEDLLEISNLILSKYSIIEENNYDLPTFFEFITILGFIYFSRLSNLDIVLVEVGMGGRLDATNVVTPLISVITNVTLEHTKILGDTLEKIANEKLGIVKDNSYLVSGNIDNSLVKLFDCVAKEHNSLHIKSSLNEYEILNQDINSTEIIINGSKYVLGLPGNHQVDNALCAFSVLETLKTIDSKWKNKLSYETYSRGFKNVKWVGRLETIMENPLIVVDGCHNIDGVNRVCDFVKTLNYSKKRAIISISADKELSTMINKIEQSFDEIIITKYSYMRSSEVETLEKLINHPNVLVIPNVSDAIEYVLSNKVPFSIFLGSLYLVSEVRNILKPL